MILIWIQGCGYSNAGTELHDITTHIIKIALFFNAYFYSKNIIFHIFHAIERYETLRAQGKLRTHNSLLPREGGDDFVKTREIIKL